MNLDAIKPRILSVDGCATEVFDQTGNLGGLKGAWSFERDRLPISGEGTPFWFNSGRRDGELTPWLMRTMRDSAHMPKL